MNYIIEKLLEAFIAVVLEKLLSWLLSHFVTYLKRWVKALAVKRGVKALALKRYHKKH